MELQQLCLGSQGRSVHILGSTLFSNWKIKAFDLISKLNTEDTNSAEQELCTEHIVAPLQHRDVFLKRCPDLHLLPMATL